MRINKTVITVISQKGIMRYFLITYIKKPNGQMDEAVAISRNVKRNDLATASVILDFKEQKVVKASFGGQLAEKNWSAIRDYYFQHYPNYITPMETAYGKLAEYAADDGPLTDDQIDQIKEVVANEKEDNPN